MGFNLRRFAPLCGALLCAGLFCGSAAAVTAADFAFAGVEGRNRAVIFAHDLKGFRSHLYASAVAPYATAAAGKWNLEACGEGALCLSLQPRGASFAVRLNEGGLSASSVFRDWEIERSECTADWREAGFAELSSASLPSAGQRKLSMAVLHRGNQRWLLGSTGGLSALQRMASVSDDSALPNDIPSDVRLWLVADLQSLSAGTLASEIPLKAQMGLNLGHDRLDLRFRANFPEVAASLLKLKPPLLNEGNHPLYGPLLLGSGKLYGLWHLSLDFVNPRLEPSDLFEEGALLNGILRRLKKVEDWTKLPLAELKDILTGALTLGIAGKMTVEGLGTVPGAYLHLSGLGEYSAAHLVKRLRSLRLGAADYELGEWRGFRLKRRLPLAALYSRDGLLLLAMDEGEEAGMPEISENESDLSAPCWNVFLLTPAELIGQLPRNAIAALRQETIQDFSDAKTSEGDPTPDPSGWPSKSSADVKSLAEATAIAAGWVKKRESAPRHEARLPSPPALSFELMKMAEGVKIASRLLQSSLPQAPAFSEPERTTPRKRWKRMLEYASALEQVFFKNYDGRNGIMTVEVNSGALAALLLRDYPPEKIVEGVLPLKRAR
ncbi:MAG: hypothetical protein ACOYD9_01155 [Pyramidobacter sp.]